MGRVKKVASRKGEEEKSVGAKRKYRPEEAAKAKRVHC